MLRAKAVAIKETMEAVAMLQKQRVSGAKAVVLLRPCTLVCAVEVILHSFVALVNFLDYRTKQKRERMGI